MNGDRAESEGRPLDGWPAERFDPEGGKIPEGEWKLVEQSGRHGWKRQRAIGRGSGLDRGKPVQVAELGGRTGGGSRWRASEVAGREH